MQNSDQDSSDVNWSEDEYRRLPILIKEAVCICVKPNLIGYHTIDSNRRRQDPKTKHNIQERMRRNAPIGMFCVDCLKPSKYSMRTVYQVCDACGDYYVPKPVPETYPIRYFLCERCDRPVPARRPKLRTDADGKPKVFNLQDFDF